MPSSAGDTKAAPTQGPPGYTPEGPYPQQQQYAPQPQPGYAPQQGFAPQGYPSPPAGGFAPNSAAAIGEQYRHALFAACAQGNHSPTTKYGVCGIITAILCFPIGLICLFTDTEQRCDRCGIKLS
ncbi:hypothetical protein MKEN_01222300 [Mycena kentingensis (nom. inval.)]|nr:hypothetical protein MKEN_01222300 [Mycena kentingensis (nom. inval.)]